MRAKRKAVLSCLTLGLAILILLPASAQDRSFRRADSNGDSALDISDAVFTLRHLFLGGAELRCRDAADANDDGAVNLSDAAFTLGFLFLSGAEPPAPRLGCGVDPTADALDCAAYDGCSFLTAPIPGQSEFETPIQGGGWWWRGGPDIFLAEDGAVPAPAPPGADPAGNPSGAPPREVEESDIYRLEGEHLFILNRYRGLQILDIANLDQPRLIGRAPVFGHPKEMYVRGDRAFIIVSDYYRFWRDGPLPASGFYGSELRIVDVSDHTQPEVIGSIDIRGDADDSRLVGDVMYVVSRRYSWHYNRDSDDNVDATDVLSVNIADPQNIRVVDRISFPRAGWDHHLHANADALYLADAAWDPASQIVRTTVRHIDISDPAGAVQVRGTARVPGLVRDRWSMDVYQGVLRVASSQSWGNGDVYLTTFDVTDPDLISRLGGYTLRVNESLTSARFDGERGYLVTYRNIDPLFTFDLSVPSRPALLGELEMTGWLDFMVPMGDRIIALGHEDLTDPNGQRRISLAVSLIDVASGDKPTLLSRVVLDGAWGGVPGERDDFAKVFKTVSELGLIVFPFQSWDDRTYRQIVGVQLIDFDFASDTLKKRGLIEDAGWVERGVPHGDDTVLTIGSEIFQTIDILDRDRPRVRGRLELARNVQNFALLPGGEYAVQLSGDWNLGDTVLSVTRADDPDTASPLSRIHVAAPYGRLFTNGGMVYVTSMQDIDPSPDLWDQRTVVNVFDFSDPLAPRARGAVTLPEAIWPSYGAWYWGQGDEVVQVDGSTLAFHRNQFYFWWGAVDCFDCGIAGRPFPQQDPTHTIHVVDLADPDQPKLASTVTIEDVNWAWGLKAAGSTLYLSSYNYLREERTADGWSYWVAKYHLHRIEVADPSAPVLRPPVNVPGMFVGAAGSGETIFTLEQRWEPTTKLNRTLFHALTLGDDQATLQSSVELAGNVNSVEIEGAGAFALSSEYVEVPPVVEDGKVIEPGRYFNRSTLLAIDLANAASLKLAGQADVPFDYAYLQAVEDGRAFLGSGAGIFVYDVTDLAAPSFAQFFRTQGWSQEIVIDANADRAFVPSGYYGVQILDLTASGVLE
jgi:hypothetical protein